MLTCYISDLLPLGRYRLIPVHIADTHSYSLSKVSAIPWPTRTFFAPEVCWSLVGLNAV